MKSPPLSASRVALVAEATISSTLLDSAMRLNLASVCSAEVIAVGVRLLAVEPPCAEPDHVLFAIDDLERQVRTDLDDDHVDGVGADVDGSDAHAGGGQVVRPGDLCRYTAVIYWRNRRSSERSSIGLPGQILP